MPKRRVGGFRWNEKVVLITGASEGIGASCAKLIGQRGARLSLTALPNENFRNQETPSAIITAGDITDPETRRAIVDRTLEHFGRIDVLINNAGVGQYGFPTDVDIEISKRRFDINVFSALALTQLVIPHMRARKSGLIVNMGSVGGEVSLPWSVMYCATKWAVHCINDALRRELDGTGIRVMKVCPGIVNTKFREHVLAGTAPPEVENIARVVSPETVAHALIRGAERSKQYVFVPKIGFVFTSLDFFATRVMDWYLQTKFSRDPAPG
jgi:short-subunit dehydrogenase